MARSRNIKPGFFMNEDLAECSHMARLTYIALWTMADREGRLEDRPKRIKAYAWPFENADIESILSELVERKFIVRYTVSDAKYIWIIKFRQNQNPHRDEAQSRFPPCPLASTIVPACDNGSSTIGISLVSDSLNSDSLNLVSDSRIPKPDASDEDERDEEFFSISDEDLPVVIQECKKLVKVIRPGSGPRRLEDRELIFKVAVLRHLEEIPEIIIAEPIEAIKRGGIRTPAAYFFKSLKNGCGERNVALTNLLRRVEIPPLARAIIDENARPPPQEVST